MNEAEALGEVRYHLTGLRQLAQAEALGVILQHEKIDYKRMAAPQGVAIIIRAEDRDRARAAIQQWYEALHPIHREVWSK